MRRVKTSHSLRDLIHDVLPGKTPLARAIHDVIIPKFLPHYVTYVTSRAAREDVSSSIDAHFLKLTHSLRYVILDVIPGKTLLARAIASNIDAHFLKVVASAIVDKYIGEVRNVGIFFRAPFA